MNQRTIWKYWDKSGREKGEKIIPGTILSFVNAVNEPFVPGRRPLCFSTLSDYKCHFLIIFIQLAVTYAQDS